MLLRAPTIVVTLKQCSWPTYRQCFDYRIKLECLPSWIIILALFHTRLTLKKVQSHSSNMRFVFNFWLYTTFLVQCSQLVWQNWENKEICRNSYQFMGIVNFQTKLRKNHLIAVKSAAMLKSNANLDFYTYQQNTLYFLSQCVLHSSSLMKNTVKTWRLLGMRCLSFLRQF